MIARLTLAAMLMFTAVACEKEVHEVRLDRVPQDRLASSNVPAAADRL